MTRPILPTLIRHEWRNLRADRATLIAVVLLVAAVVYGLYNGRSWQEFQSESIRAVKAAEKLRFSEIEELLTRLDTGIEPPPPTFLDARRPSTMGDAEGGAVRHPILPPAPLGAFAIGQSDLLPYYMKVTLFTNELALFENGELENPQTLLAGRFDLAFVVVFLLPLVVLSLSYNLLSLEKEQGTFAIALAQPVRLGTLVGAKVAVQTTLLLSVVAGLLILALALVDVDLGADGIWLRIVGWIVVVCLYVAFWLALSVAVNALGRSSATNATILAAAWLLLTIIAPSLVNITAVSLHPVPSRVELVSATRAARADALARGKRVLHDYSDGYREIPPGAELIDSTNAAAVTYVAMEQVGRNMEPILADFNARLDAQQRLTSRFRFLSPAMVAQDALVELAGTGLGRHRHFRVSVERFIAVWKNYFAPRIFRGDYFGPGATASLPDYAFVEEPIDAVIRRTAPAVLGLGLLVSIEIAACILLLRTYSFLESEPCVPVWSV